MEHSLDSQTHSQRHTHPRSQCHTLTLTKKDPKTSSCCFGNSQWGSEFEKIQQQKYTHTHTLWCQGCQTHLECLLGSSQNLQDSKHKHRHYHPLPPDININSTVSLWLLLLGISCCGTRIIQKATLKDQQSSTILEWKISLRGNEEISVINYHGKVNNSSTIFNPCLTPRHICKSGQGKKYIVPTCLTQYT